MHGGILTNNTRRNAVGRIIVEVMPKPEILDPQGKAVGSALPRLGITSFEAVRQGKCFHLTVDGPVTDELLEQARKAFLLVLLVRIPPRTLPGGQVSYRTGSTPVSRRYASTSSTCATG